MQRKGLMIFVANVMPIKLLLSNTFLFCNAVLVIGTHIALNSKQFRYLVRDYAAEGSDLLLV